jgi:hypothetical protein
VGLEVASSTSCVAYGFQCSQKIGIQVHPQQMAIHGVETNEDVPPKQILLLQDLLSQLTGTQKHGF